MECCWRPRERWWVNRRCKARHGSPKGRNCGPKSEAKPKHRRVRRLKELLALYDKGYYRSIWKKVERIEKEEQLHGRVGNEGCAGHRRIVNG